MAQDRIPGDGTDPGRDLFDQLGAYKLGKAMEEAQRAGATADELFAMHDAHYGS